MVYVTRKVKFSAAHRLYNPTFSDERNDEIFDICNNVNGHGHNYVLEVTVKGNPDPETGYVIDLKKLKRIIDENITRFVDHKHLNMDVEFLRGIIPSAENVAMVFWDILKNKIDEGELHSLKLYESEANFVEYFGEKSEIKIFE